METRYLLDTNTFIYIRREQPESVLEDSANCSREKPCFQ
jgi:hypothetical protein